VQHRGQAQVGQALAEEHGLSNTSLGQLAIVVRLGMTREIEVSHCHVRHSITTSELAASAKKRPGSCV